MEKLLVNHLRIGNLVYHRLNDFSEFNVTPIVGLNSNDFNLLEHAGHIKPIPLTEEWLLKFGFSLDEGITIRVSEFNWFSLSNLNIGYFYSVNGGEYLIGKPIKYVHQLQNLYFALTGNELTLKP
jgi:hypothetical protein